MKPKTRRKPKERVKVQGQAVKFDDVFDKAHTVISGIGADLIRDAHDQSVRWIHNCHALPDNREKAFLIGRGWSAQGEVGLARRRMIREARIDCMAINDYPDDPTCKPDYWVAGDPAINYGERIWTDQEVMKFSPIRTATSHRPRDDAYAPLLTPKDAPNGHFYHQVNDDADVESWLHKPWINWGMTLHGEKAPKPYFTSGAARSSMLCGLRLLWHLGYREVYLLGCDCTPGQHPAPMYWPAIFDYVGQLTKTFNRWGFHVMQTNPSAHLRCFDFVRFEDAFK